MPQFPNRIIQLADIQGVGSGKTCIINCPKKYRYKYIGLRLQDSAAGNGNAPLPETIVDLIQIILGTGVQRQLRASSLNLVNKAMGSDADYGVQALVAGGAAGTGVTLLPIYFEEPWRKRADYQDGLAWQTGFLSNKDVFQIKLKLQAGITPVISAFAIVDDFDGGKPHPILKMFEEDANTNNSTLELSNMFQGVPANDFLSQISLLDTSDGKTVSQVRMAVGSDTILEDVTSQDNAALLTNLGMRPAAGAFHIVLDHDDRFEGLRQVRDMGSVKLKQTFSAASAGTQSRVTQRLGLPE